MRVALVLGTRPEIIKLFPVLVALRTAGAEVDIVHTNQHYSPGLDARFFGELALPAPEWNLEVGSGPHGDQTGRMLVRLEPVLSHGRYDWVVVQGDTNSALAGALAAAKLPVRVAHVEAGLRSFNREMPEEVNRRLIDHMADLLLPPTEAAAAQLAGEQVPGAVSDPTGNTIVDAVVTVAGGPRTLEERDGRILLTVHRAENVDDPQVLAGILGAVGDLAQAQGLAVDFPIHPRTESRVRASRIALHPAIEVTPPTSFRRLVELESRARLVMTDSGGLQEESCVLGTPCVTLRTTTERPETVAVGANVVAGVEPAGILSAAERMLSLPHNDWEQPFGDGRAGERIAALLSTDAAALAAG